MMRARVGYDPRKPLPGDVCFLPYGLHRLILVVSVKRITREIAKTLDFSFSGADWVDGSILDVITVDRHGTSIFLPGEYVLAPDCEFLTMSSYVWMRASGIDD